MKIYQLLLAAALFTLPACEQKKALAEELKEKVSGAIDEEIKNATKEVKDAAKETTDGLIGTAKETTDGIKDATNDAKDAVNKATE